MNLKSAIKKYCFNSSKLIFLGEVILCGYEVDKLCTTKLTRYLIKNTTERVDEWFDVTEKYLAFSEDAHAKFMNGSVRVRKEMLFMLGSNLLLKDQKLLVVMPKILQSVETTSTEVSKIHDRFEPQNNVGKQSYHDDLYSKSTILLPDRDSTTYTSVFLSFYEFINTVLRSPGASVRNEKPFVPASPEAFFESLSVSNSKAQKSFRFSGLLIATVGGGRSNLYQ